MKNKKGGQMIKVSIYVVVSFLVPIILIVNTLEASQKATINQGSKDAGKIVTLDEDGTWKFDDSSKSDLGTNTTFRKTIWGMSVSKVKSIESSQLLTETNDMLTFLGYIDRIKTLIIYIFIDDKLARTRYSFESPHSTPDNYVTDYDKINKRLSTKYGTAKEELVEWSKGIPEMEREHYGFSVISGMVKLTSKWETDDTEIIHFLGGDNLKAEHWLQYDSKKLKALSNKKDYEETLFDY